MSSTAALPPIGRATLDLSPLARAGIAVAAGGISLLVAFAVLRWALGIAPPTPWARDFALAVHLATVIPAIPLGAWVLLTRKGGARHRLLGKVWLALMFVTAVSTIFIGNLSGGFSWLHIFTVLTLIAVPQVIVTARQRRIAAHKKQMVQFYLGAMVIAGGTAFLPGRTMWQWAFG
jgi:uncharacterized membrane protein